MRPLNEYQIKLISEGFVSSNKHESKQVQVDNLIKLLSEMNRNLANNMDEKLKATYRLVRFVPEINTCNCELTGNPTNQPCLVYDVNNNVGNTCLSVLMVDFNIFIKDEHDSNLLTLKPTVELL